MAQTPIRTVDIRNFIDKDFRERFAGKQEDLEFVDEMLAEHPEDIGDFMVFVDQVKNFRRERDAAHEEWRSQFDKSKLVRDQISRHTEIVLQGDGSLHENSYITAVFEDDQTRTFLNSTAVYVPRRDALEFGRKIMGDLVVAAWAKSSNINYGMGEGSVVEDDTITHSNLPDESKGWDGSIENLDHVVFEFINGKRICLQVSEWGSISALEPFHHVFEKKA